MICIRSNNEDQLVLKYLPEIVNYFYKIQLAFINSSNIQNNQTIKKRLIKRGDDLKEAERRVSHDNDDFKGIENEVDKIVYNNDGTNIDDVVQKILKYMGEVKS